MLKCSTSYGRDRQSVRLKRKVFKEMKKSYMGSNYSAGEEGNVSRSNASVE